MKLVLAVVAGALFANIASRLIAWAKEEEEACEEREERLDAAVAEWKQAERERRSELN